MYKRLEWSQPRIKRYEDNGKEVPALEMFILDMNNKKIKGGTIRPKYLAKDFDGNPVFEYPRFCNFIEDQIRLHVADFGNVEREQIKYCSKELSSRDELLLKDYITSVTGWLMSNL